jgi:hypothetical protein
MASFIKEALFPHMLEASAIPPPPPMRAEKLFPGHLPSTCQRRAINRPEKPRSRMHAESPSPPPDFPTPNEPWRRMRTTARFHGAPPVPAISSLLTGGGCLAQPQSWAPAPPPRRPAGHWLVIDPLCNAAWIRG